jgi:O-methyltransferase involved in polyketide biosynthesis
MWTEVIEYRLKLIEETSRSRCVPKSIFDRNWFREVGYSEDNGIFIIAGGLFGYFEESKVTSLLSSMAEYFPAGELMFDIQSRLGNAVVNRQIEKTGASGVRFRFALGNPKKRVTEWSDKIEVVDWFPMFSRTRRNPRWSRKTRLTMSISDLFAASKMVHLRFQP